MFRLKPKLLVGLWWIPNTASLLYIRFWGVSGSVDFITTSHSSTLSFMSIGLTLCWSFSKVFMSFSTQDVWWFGTVRAMNDKMSWFLMTLNCWFSTEARTKGERKNNHDESKIERKYAAITCTSYFLVQRDPETNFQRLYVEFFAFVRTLWFARWLPQNLSCTARSNHETHKNNSGFPMANTICCRLVMDKS